MLNNTEYQKMKCMQCGGLIHIDVEDLPGHINTGEAVKHECPHCEQMAYVVLFEEEQEIVKTSEKKEEDAIN